tara:strand:- start:624 stop:860 length:237 start_codon:yes stop_codon:yes gene_type:complete
MNICEYYSLIPYQLLLNAGLPNNYYDLTIEQEFLFEYLLQDHARLLNANRKLEAELVVLSGDMEECESLKWREGNDVY